MKKYWIKELSENDMISNEVFIVLKKAIPVSKNNKPYMNLILGDKTGQIDTRVWDHIEKYKGLFEQGDYIKVTGTVTSYQGSKQLIVKYLEAVKDDEMAIEDFLPTSDYDLEEMTNSLFEFINSVENPFIQKLLKKIFTNSYILRGYQYSPAGKSIHHAYLSGLLEHSLSVASLCDRILENYEHLEPPISRDLVIAGALMHDIGKIYELDFDKGFRYTTEGQLIGHVVIGYQLLVDIANSIEGFPEKIRIHLGHLILSHQGKLEYGSPKTPTSLEAFVLHSADELDSKINHISGQFPLMKEKGKVWSDYLRSVEGYVVNSHEDITTVQDSDIPQRRRYLDLLQKKGIRPKATSTEKSGSNTEKTLF